MPRQVIQFSTGNVGRHALQAIIERPDLELVGVHAADTEKAGRDAAELCELDESTGVTATNDIDALVALEADCVVYTSQAEPRPHAAIKEITKFLRAGTNVVGTSLVWLVAPQHADDWLRTPLEQACEAGGTSLYINGIDPGFSGDTLVYTALSHPAESLQAQIPRPRGAAETGLNRRSAARCIQRPPVSKRSGATAKQHDALTARSCGSSTPCQAYRGIADRPALLPPPD